MLKHRDALVVAVVLAALVPPVRAAHSQEIRVTPALGLYLPLGRVGGVLIDEPSLGKQQIQTEIGRASCREECRSRWWPYH